MFVYTRVTTLLLNYTTFCLFYNKLIINLFISLSIFVVYQLLIVMPRKGRLNLGRRTYTANVTRKRPATEDDNEAQVRRDEDRERQALRRAEECEQQTLQRLDEQRDRQAAPRQDETEQQAQQRLDEQRYRQAAARQDETEQQAQQRLDEQLGRQAAARHGALPDERRRRLTDNQNRLPRTHNDARETPSPFQPFQPFSGGQMNVICEHCDSLSFPSDKFNCCHDGKVHLDDHPFPPELQRLFETADELSLHFRSNIRRYNTAFAFASLTAKQDTPPPPQVVALLFFKFVVSYTIITLLFILTTTIIHHLINYTFMNLPKQITFVALIQLLVNVVPMSWK